MKQKSGEELLKEAMKKIFSGGGKPDIAYCKGKFFDDIKKIKFGPSRK